MQSVGDEHALAALLKAALPSQGVVPLSRSQDMPSAFCSFSFSFSKSICQPAVNLDKVLIRALVNWIYGPSLNLIMVSFTSYTV